MASVAGSTLKQMIGNGFMVIASHQGERYQGIVAIEGILSKKALMPISANQAITNPFIYPCG